MKLKDCLPTRHSVETPNFKVVMVESSGNVKMSVNKKTGVVSGPKSAGLTRNDTVKIGSTIGQVTDAVRQYYSGRKHSLHLFAKTQDDKRLYGHLVKDLLKTGMYKQKRKLFVSGGMLWELQRMKL